MIEKLDLDKRNSFGTLDWLKHWNEPSGAKLIEEKVNQLVDAVNELHEEAENNARIRANHENLIDTLVAENNIHERQIDELQAQVAILEEHAHPTAKTPDYDDTDDIAEVKNENLYTKKKLDRAMWWLKEIVNNHRFTPITTAEMALKELNKKTSVWDIQDYLKSNEDLANFLESSLEENDYDFLKIAVNDVITALRKKGE